MSGPLLTAIDREAGDTLFAGGHEGVGELLVFPNELEERAWPEASADDKGANPIGTVNQAIHDFDLWRDFQENRRVEVSTFKHRPLSHTRIRPAEGGQSSLSSSLTARDKTLLNALFIHRVPLFSTNNCVVLPTFRNDNWHPLEAA